MNSALVAALARNIRAERTRVKLSQSELGSLVGWSQKTVERIEAGDRRIYFDELPAICQALGISVPRLLLDVPTDDMDLMFPPARGR